MTNRRSPATPFGLFAWLLWLAACLGPAAWAAPSSPPSPLIAVPELRSLVTDTGGALTSAQQAALREKLDELQAHTGPQIAVLVVPTTGGEDIAAYATRAFAQWQLGTRKDDDGLLILVALKDRRMRIEVGQGLESRVPDILAGRIIDEQMAPRLRQSDVYGGIDAAVDVLIERLGGGTVVGAGEDGDASTVASSDVPAEGHGESALLMVIGGCFAAAFCALILGVTGFGMRAAYRRSRIVFTLQWLIVLGITGYVAYATDGEWIPIALAGTLSMLFVFAASLGGQRGGDSSDDDDDDDSSRSGSSSSSSSSSSDSGSSGGGGSSSGGGASGSW